MENNRQDNIFAFTDFVAWVGWWHYW